jgi:hypothetical protein
LIRGSFLCINLIGKRERIKKKNGNNKKDLFPFPSFPSEPSSLPDPTSSTHAAHPSALAPSAHGVRSRVGRSATAHTSPPTHAHKNRPAALLPLPRSASSCPRRFLSHQYPPRLPHVESPRADRRCPCTKHTGELTSAMNLRPKTCGSWETAVFTPRRAGAPLSRFRDILRRDPFRGEKISCVVWFLFSDLVLMSICYHSPQRLAAVCYPALPAMPPCCRDVAAPAMAVSRRASTQRLSSLTVAAPQVATHAHDSVPSHRHRLAPWPPLPQRDRIHPTPVQCSCLQPWAGATTPGRVCPLLVAQLAASAEPALV